ncbi:MAG: DUF4245 domain-containing protein [Mycobacteriaceae bacterium]
MASDKPRILHSNRDMIWSMVPLVILCIVIAGIAGQCAFSPGGKKQGTIPSFDAKAALSADARQIGFPVRLPVVPQGWKSNSGSTSTISGSGGGRQTTVGYITNSGRYLSLTQSNAVEQVLVRDRTDFAGQPSSVVEIDQVRWSIYEPTGEKIWLADLGAVRLLITGAGSTEEFTDLARATTGQDPLASS